MRKILIALFATAVVLSACQKEPSFEDPNNIPGGGSGGNTASVKLVRIGSRVGADTITSNYTYTASGSINSFSQSGVINGSLFTAEIRTVRNASNIITSTILKTNVLAQFGLDSIVNFHTYDAANSRYKYSISRITIFGSTETDSIVYTYDAAGKLASAIDYYDDGSGYAPYSKEEYTYTGANLSTTKSYSYDDVTNAFTLDQTETNEYDTKANPLSFPADAPILGMTVFYPANNSTKTTTVETSPPATTVRNIAYTYTTSNLPATAVSSGGSGAAASVNTYYYQ